MNQILITVVTVAAIHGFLALILVISERLFVNYGLCKITINGKKEIEVQGGLSLLATLNQEKIFLPSACGGRGTCAYCKCQVSTGGGPYLPTETALLNPEEIQNKVRLSCQVKVKNDLFIDIPEELFKIQEFQAVVNVLKDLTYDIKLIELKLIKPDEIDFKPGQYIQLTTEPYNGVKKRVSRAYSIASPATLENSIHLMIRMVPEGICTTWVHQYLQEGDQVRFVGPMGDFYLREGKGEIVFVAGGSGMAPMVPLLSEITQKKIQRKVTYFFGAVTERDLFYIEEMKSYEKKNPEFQFIPVLSQAENPQNWKGEVGLVTLPLERYLKTIETPDVQGYLCGSPGLVNASIQVMNRNGVQKDRIFYDPFA